MKYQLNIQTGRVISCMIKIHVTLDQLTISPYFRENFLQLDVYYPHLETLVVQQQAAYTIPSFFGKCSVNYCNKIHVNLRTCVCDFWKSMLYLAILEVFAACWLTSVTVLSMVESLDVLILIIPSHRRQKNDICDNTVTFLNGSQFQRKMKASLACWSVPVFSQAVPWRPSAEHSKPPLSRQPWIARDIILYSGWK